MIMYLYIRRRQNYLSFSVERSKKKQELTLVTIKSKASSYCKGTKCIIYKVK